MESSVQQHTGLALGCKEGWNGLRQVSQALWDIQRQRNPTAQLHQHLGALERATSIPGAGALPKQHSFPFQFCAYSPPGQGGAAVRQAGRTAGNSAAEQQDGIWAKRMASTVTARRSAGREVSCTALLEMASAKV